MNSIWRIALVLLVAATAQATLQAAQNLPPGPTYAVATDAIDPFWDDIQPVFATDQPTAVPSHDLLGGISSAIDFGPIIDDLPPFYVQSEALFLHRDNRTINQPFYYQDVALPLTTHDFAFPAWMPGTKISAGYCFSNGLALEALYFGMQDLNARASVNSNLTPEPLVFTYNSRLQNFEANLVAPVGNVGLLAGFRYLSWNESLNIIADTAYPYPGGLQGNFDNLISHNSLFGFQIGARMRAYWRQVTFDFTPKAGLYDNVSKRYILNEGVVQPDQWSQASSLALVGELPLSTTFQISEHIALRGGYNLIFINGLALAPDQLVFYYNSPYQSVVHNHGGSVLLQGVSVGLEARW